MPKEIEWSVSRIKSYLNCKLQYHLNYNKKIKSNWSSPEAMKGTAFHYIAENYAERKDWTFDQLVECLTSHPIKWGQKVNMSQVDTEQLEYAFENLKVFWSDFVEAGQFDQIFKEKKINFYIDENLFQAYVDLILVKDGKYILVDYKTSKTKGKSEDHNLQLVTYVYAIWQEFGKDVTLEDFLDKIQVYLYYPYAENKRGTLSNLMFKDINRLSNLEPTVDFLSSSISAITEESDWSPTVSFTCNFCAFQGTDFCEASKLRGFKRIRGITFSE